MKNIITNADVKTNSAMDSADDADGSLRLDDRSQRIEMPRIPDGLWLVTDYGAVGDGMTMNTGAISSAIQACADAGGGRVVIPPGVWLTGPISLRSRTEIYAERGALVLFSQNFDDYPLVSSTFEGIPTVRCQSPIDGEDLEDIAITGEGIFDGAGEAWRPVKREKMTNAEWTSLLQSGGVLDDAGRIWWPTKEARDGSSIVKRLQQEGIADPLAFKPARDFLRPVLVSLRRCRRVLLDGPTFQNSACWCLHPWACQHLTVRNVMVRNPWSAQNGDGIDLDSCQHVLLENSSFDVGDDAICLKSGRDEAGRKLGIASAFIQIRDCVVYHGHGGVVIGSEMSGGVHDVNVSDCTFIGTDIGLRFKSARGRGGVVENILMERIRMKNIAGEAISFHMFYDGQEGSGEGSDVEMEVSEETPVFRDIRIKDVVCTGAKRAVLMNGLAELPLANVAIGELTASCDTGISLNHATGIRLNQVRLRVQAGPLVELNQCTNALVNGLIGEDFLHGAAMVLSGERTEGIVCRGSRTCAGRLAEASVRLAPGVRPGALTLD